MIFKAKAADKFQAAQQFSRNKPELYIHMDIK